MRALMKNGNIVTGRLAEIFVSRKVAKEILDEFDHEEVEVIEASEVKSEIKEVKAKVSHVHKPLKKAGRPLKKK